MKEDGSSLQGLKKTLVVNLAGGPGATKSTHALAITAQLKRLGVDVEMVPEFAKDKTWQRDDVALSCQPYITAVQFFNIYRLLGHVDVVVTDSPIFLGLAYAGYGTGESWAHGVIEQFQSMDNMTFYLERDRRANYSSKGRNEDYDQAILKDAEIKAIMEKYQIEYIPIQVNTLDTSSISVNRCVELIIRKHVEDKECQLNHRYETRFGCAQTPA